MGAAHGASGSPLYGEIHMKKHRYDVPTRVLVEQGRISQQQLTLAANAARAGQLSTFGLDVEVFAPELKAAADSLADLDAAQERAKSAYLKEAKDDQALAERGYRFKLQLDARVRACIATNGDDDNLAGRFRFGHLRIARARGVLHELRIVLPEAMALHAKLKAFGVTEAFIADGQAIAAALGGDKESAEAKREREMLTVQVNAEELVLSRLLDRLRQADEGVALDEPALAPVFRLDLIKAELNRIKAAREARLAARTGTEDPED